MRRLFVIVGLFFSMAALCQEADIDVDEAARVFEAQLERALSIARAKVARDPLDLEGYLLESRALRALDRLNEDIELVEDWASDAPDTFQPLWILLAHRRVMEDWTSLSNLAQRAPSRPETERRRFLQEIIRLQLANERFDEAVATLKVTPPHLENDPFADLFATLEAIAVRDWSNAYSSLSKYLESEKDESTQTKILWWTAEVARIVAPTCCESTDPNVAMSPMEGDDLPVRKRNVSPDYPDEMRRQRVEGRVHSRVVILTSGHAAFPTVVSSSDPIFEPAVRKALVGWRYEPARRDGNAMPMYYTVVFKFTLR